MKKILFMLTMAISLSAYGQIDKTAETVFYGVDYSLAKVYGASETFEQFETAFHNINLLFLTQPKKYSAKSILKVNVVETDLVPVNERNGNLNTVGFYVTSDVYEPSTEEIAAAIRSLFLKEKNGTGLIVIAKLLNKVEQQGAYSVVYFDIATREVLGILHTKGKAKGFGLRNYWGRSVLEGLKKL